MNLVNCEVGQWSAWDECRRNGLPVCGSKRGRQKRQRPVLQKPTARGRQCPATIEFRKCRAKNRSCEGLSWYCITFYHSFILVLLTVTCSPRKLYGISQGTRFQIISTFQEWKRTIDETRLKQKKDFIFRHRLRDEQCCSYVNIKYLTLDWLKQYKR